MTPGEVLADFRRRADVAGCVGPYTDGMLLTRSDGSSVWVSS